MQEKKNDSYSLGICQRLFNVIMNGLIAGGLKRVTLGHPTVAAGSMVAQQNKSSSKLNGEVMPVHYLDHENSQDDLRVNFRESEGLESWTQVGDKFGSSNYGPEKEGAVVHSGKNTTTPVKRQESKDKATEGWKKTGSETPRSKDLQGKSFHYTEPNQKPVSRPRDTTKIITLKDSTEEEKKKSKENNIEPKDSEGQGDKSTKQGKKIPSGPSTNNSLTLALDEKLQAKTPSPRKIRPSLGDINEISDEFIRRRKEAMSKTLSSN